MIEHHWTHEQATRTKRTAWGDVHLIVWHRWLCTCGGRTSWWRDRESALGDRARHACDGQLSVSV